MSSASALALKLPANTIPAMPLDHTFESFEKELNRLVESFGKRLTELKQPGYELYNLTPEEIALVEGAA
jgi:hypothetical protein